MLPMQTQKKLSSTVVLIRTIGEVNWLSVLSMVISISGSAPARDQERIIWDRISAFCAEKDTGRQGRAIISNLDCVSQLFPGQRSPPPLAVLRRFCAHQ